MPLGVQDRTLLARRDTRRCFPGRAWGRLGGIAMRRNQVRPASSRAAAVMLAICVECATAFAALPQTAPGAHAEQVKSAISKLGVGKHVRITLASGENVRGNIAGVGVNSFSIQPDHAATAQQIAYADVTRIHTGSNRLVWIALGVVVVSVVIVVIAIARTPSVHSAT